MRGPLSFFQICFVSSPLSFITSTTKKGCVCCCAMKPVRKSTGSNSGTVRHNNRGWGGLGASGIASNSSSLAASTSGVPRHRRPKAVNHASPPTTIELRGVPIHFPFQPYKCQEDYMGVVLDALLRRENALLESPTGELSYLLLWNQWLTL